MFCRYAFATLVTAAIIVPVHSADWPAFRGEAGDGTTAETDFPTQWSQTENIRWRVELPTPANGSPIVSNGRVFVTCAADEGRQRSLFCFDRNNGEQLWVQTVEFEKKMPTHKTNPYAGSTPAADGKRVVVWHSSAGLYCYDFAGNEIWKRDLGEFKHIWGYGSSPVIYKDRVILHTGPGKRIFLTAIELDSGKTIWETEEPHKGNGEEREDGKWMGSWSTPVLATVDGNDIFVCTLPTRVNGYDPQSGDILWSCDGIRGPRGDLAYSSPLIRDGFCVATGGYKGPAVGFKIAGTGNITDSQRQWRVEQNPQSIGSGVFLGRYIYRPNASPGTIQCLNAFTGQQLWQARSGTNWGSISAAGDTLYVTNQDGTTNVFKANPEKFELIAENKLGETCNSTPALSDGEIFIRTHKHLYCIGGR